MPSAVLPPSESLAAPAWVPECCGSLVVSFFGSGWRGEPVDMVGSECETWIVSDRHDGLPSARASSSSSPQKRVAVASSRALVGSSSRIAPACARNARASETRWRSPPDSSAASVSSGRSSWARARAAVSAWSSASGAVRRRFSPMLAGSTSPPCGISSTASGRAASGNVDMSVPATLTMPLRGGCIPRAREGGYSFLHHSP